MYSVGNVKEICEKYNVQCITMAMTVAMIQQHTNNKLPFEKVLEMAEVALSEENDVLNEYYARITSIVNDILDDEKIEEEDE